MKQVYMAEDGTIFETKGACLDYEKSFKDVFAFGPAGRLSATNVHNALVIWFESQEAYDWFFKDIDYEKNSSSLKGLKEAEDYNWGTVFVWSEDERRYFPVWDIVIDTLQKISK